MWIFLTDSFLSVVDKGDPSGRTLLVRGRRKGDIEAVFPDATVATGGGTDYAFRARIDREQVALAMADAVRGVRYENFRKSVGDADRHEACYDVWKVMFRYQQIRRG